MMEVFAGLPRHTDHQIGRLLDFLERVGELDNTLIMVISDNGASAEGGPTGTTNEAQFFNNAPGADRGEPRRDRRDRRPQALQPLPVGLDVGRATRRSAAGSARPTAAARRDPFIVSWPKGIKAQGRGARASTRTSSTWCRPCSTCSASSRRPTIRGVTQSPLHGVSFAHTLDDADGRDAAPHAVLRDARPPGDLPRRLAGGLPVAGAVVRRGRQGVRRADLRGDADRARRDGLGALPRRRGLRREPRTSLRRTATG